MTCLLACWGAFGSQHYIEICKQMRNQLLSIFKGCSICTKVCLEWLTWGGFHLMVTVICALIAFGLSLFVPWRPAFGESAFSGILALLQAMVWGSLTPSCQVVLPSDHHCTASHTHALRAASSPCPPLKQHTASSTPATNETLL